MKVKDMFRLQEQATPHNIKAFKKEFAWCHNALELGVDSFVYLGTDSVIVTYRKSFIKTDNSEYEAINVICNITYDAVGSLISALRLLEFGVIADVWALVRVAFESTCYAEYFALHKDKIQYYVSLATDIQRDRSANIGKKLYERGLNITRVIDSLEQQDGSPRKPFYNTLCNFGTHTSPIRCGLRIKRDEVEDVRAYLSINHREFRNCLHNLAATANYAVGIPFEAWPDLMMNNSSIWDQHKSLEEEYKTTFFDIPQNDKVRMNPREIEF